MSSTITNPVPRAAPPGSIVGTVVGTAVRLSAEPAAVLIAPVLAVAIGLLASGCIDAPSPPCWTPTPERLTVTLPLRDRGEVREHIGRCLFDVCEFVMRPVVPTEEPAGSPGVRSSDVVAGRVDFDSQRISVSRGIQNIPRVTAPALLDAVDALVQLDLSGDKRRLMTLFDEYLATEDRFRPEIRVEIMPRGGAGQNGRDLVDTVRERNEFPARCYNYQHFERAHHQIVVSRARGVCADEIGTHGCPVWRFQSREGPVWTQELLSRTGITRDEVHEAARAGRAENASWFVSNRTEEARDSIVIAVIGFIALVSVAAVVAVVTQE